MADLLRVGELATFLVSRQSLHLPVLDEISRTKLLTQSEFACHARPLLVTAEEVCVLQLVKLLRFCGFLHEELWHDVILGHCITWKLA